MTGDIFAWGRLGFGTKTTRHIVRLRKMETHRRDEAGALLETCRQALGLH